METGLYCACVQLDQTKTSDGKSNFLNVLVNAVTSTHPDALNLADDLPSITDASRGDQQLAEYLLSAIYHNSLL